jgi:hypothetical protein
LKGAAPAWALRVRGRRPVETWSDAGVLLHLNERLLDDIKKNAASQRGVFFLMRMEWSARLTRRCGATIAVRRMSAFAAGFRCELMILGEAALLVRDTAATLAGDLSLLVPIHGREAPVGRRFALLLHTILLVL